MFGYVSTVLDIIADLGWSTRLDCLVNGEVGSSASLMNDGLSDKRFFAVVVKRG